MSVRQEQFGPAPAAASPGNHKGGWRQQDKWISKIGDEANSEKHEEEIMGARSSVGMQIIRGLNKGIPPARIAEEYLPELVTRVLEAWKSLKEDEYWSCHKLLNDEEHTPMGSDRPFIVSGHLGLMRAVRQQEERYGNIIVQRNVVIGVLNGARYREQLPSEIL